MPATEIEDLLRDLAPQVLSSLVRRHRDFDSCEDAVQEALLAAAQQWPSDGVPGNPKGWLVAVASRRRIEMWRNEAARKRREETVAIAATEPDPAPADDDLLTLMLLCCHPSLTPVSQVALTLRAVGGLSTAEIARALLVPEATVGQRISRAKQTIKASGAEFRMPPPSERAERIAAVQRVLYLVFNEGYTASSGPSLLRVELTNEAIRLARQLHALLPDDGEVTGLLALMLLTDARRPARARPTAPWFRSTSRTVACGTPRRSLRASASSPMLLPMLPSVPTSCRPPSPRCTTRPRAPRTPIGGRSSRCTSCSTSLPPGRWSRSTASSRSRW